MIDSPYRKGHLNHAIMTAIIINIFIFVLITIIININRKSSNISSSTSSRGIITKIKVPVMMLSESLVK